ncbi:protein YLS9-like [Panicum miliaceum]|uniref:Protein YLS9-like n=1 Tax=Panicum miliaceum TaxID=4540 RepID=A0A3L6SW67_PANMI|nr:protein YLS9-like [Panicum miliaceum]
MSKDCGNHGEDDLRRSCRRLLALLLGLALIVAIIALIVYLVLRPTHPRFFLQDASLRQLDLSNGSSSLLSTTLQGHGDVDVWSPVLAGPNVPFAPYLADALTQDCQAGYLILQVKIDGRVRWKVGSWISGHYHLFVTCPAFLVTNGGNGAPGASGFKFQTTTSCRVEV